MEQNISTAMLGGFWALQVAYQKESTDNTFKAIKNNSHTRKDTDEIESYSNAAFLDMIDYVKKNLK